MKGLQFVYVFVGAFIGLLFAEPIADIANAVANNTTGMASTLYGYISVFYALCCVGLMVGSLYKFFRG